jgi:hypothetical protein
MEEQKTGLDLKPIYGKGQCDHTVRYNASYPRLCSGGSGLSCVKHTNAELRYVSRVEFAKRMTVILKCPECGQTYTTGIA